FADDAPGRREGGSGHGAVITESDAVEARGEGVVHAWRGFGAEAQADFGECGGGIEALQRTRQGRSRARGVEAGKRVQVTVQVHDDQGATAREEVESLPEAALGPSRTLGDRRDHAGLPRGEPHDAARLAVVEGVE